MSAVSPASDRFAPTGSPGTEPFAALGGYPHDDDQRVLFHATPVPTVVVDLATMAVAPNEAFRRLFDFPPGPITIDDLEAATRPQDPDEAEAYRRSLVGGATVDVDQRYVRCDGSLFWGHLTAAPLFDAEGERWGVIGAIADVTDRVEARTGLIESEQRFRALVQNVADAIVVLDDRGRLLYASPSGESLTGNRTEDFVGADIFSFIHRDDRDVVARTYASIFSAPRDPTEPNVPLQFRVVHNDGSVRFVEAVATNLLDDPAVNGVVVNVRDLTDSAVAQSALELTESRFQRMIENISDTVTLLDEDAGVVRHGNVRPIFGHPLELWEGRSLFDLVHADDRGRIEAAFDHLRTEPGSAMTEEVRVRPADGSWIDVEIDAVNLLHDPDVAAVVITSRDITERKRAERELNQARDQAVQALQMRTEFIASVSHELRSPIHGVLGLSELLASATLDDDARQLAQAIGRATETLQMVLDDILDYAKIEVGRLELDLRPLLVSEVADDLAALYGSEARAKGIDLAIEAEVGFPQRVRADGLRVRQVLTNLVGNAVKFTTEGEVRVRATREPARADGVTRVRIEVSDTGIGIPPDAYDRLFQPFSQAHTSTAREFGGSGLGLSIAKRLVELMGGELGFASVPRKGSTFWFVLPVEELEERSVAAPEPVADHDERPAVKPVMVVEDNAVNQLLVRRQLQRLGFEAIVFDSGSAAIDRYPETDASVVLMDWALPGMDGLETTRRLRALERELGLARTPIVAMTASSRPGDRERCLASGMDDFIAKPVSMGTLGEVIRRWTPSPFDPPADSPLHRSTGDRRSRRHDARPTIAGIPVDDRSLADPVGVASGTGSGAIDVFVLDRLVEDLSDPQLVASVVRTYLRELPLRVDGIDQARLTHDPGPMEAACHLLRSTSAAVGASRLAELCGQLEAGETEPDDAAVEQVRREAEIVRTELGRLLDDHLVVAPSTIS